MGSTTTARCSAPAAPRPRATAHGKASVKGSGASAPGETLSSAAARKSVRRAAAASREGGVDAMSDALAPAARPRKSWPAPRDVICGPMYIPWETCEPPSLCCGTKAMLARVVASRAARVVDVTSRAQAAPPTSRLSAPSGPRSDARGFPPLLSPASSSSTAIPSPSSSDSLANPPQPDFLASLTHLAYPSPAASVSSCPATSPPALGPDFSTSSALSAYSSPPDTGNFDEEMLSGPFDLSTFSRPTSPKSGAFELKLEEEDLTLLAEVKQEDEWASGQAAKWSW